MFNFKQWRTERNLNKSQAAALLDQDSNYWTMLEGSPKPHKAAAVAEVLKHHDNREQWQELKRKASLLTPAEIEGFLMAGKAQGLTQGALGKMCGFSGSSTLKKFVNKKGKLNKARFVSLLCMAAQIEKMKSTPEPEQFQAEDQQQEAEPQAVVSFEFEHQGQMIPFKVTERDGERMMTLRQFGEAMGYKDPYNSAKHLFDRWVEKSKQVKDHSRVVELSTLDGKIRQTLVLFERAITFLALKAETERGIAFSDMVSEVVYKAERGHDFGAQQQFDPLDAMIMSLKELKAANAKISQLEKRTQQLEQANYITAENLPHAAEALFESVVEEKKSRQYYLNKHVKNAARELADKVHGPSDQENIEMRKAFIVYKVQEINTQIKHAVAKNWDCFYADAPGRDKYKKLDFVTAYKELNAWRELNGLSRQLRFDLMEVSV